MIPFLKILAVLPMFIYPFIALANLMQLAANNSTFLVKLFLWGSLLYPVVYFGLIYFFNKTGNPNYLYAILVYLALCIVLFLKWIYFS